MATPENHTWLAGSKMEEVNLLLMRQVMASVGGEPVVSDEEVGIKVLAGAMLAAIGPRNELEGMLAAQMVGLHFATLNDFAAARACPAEDVRQALLLDATDKCRVFAQQVQALVTLQDLEKLK